MRLYYSVRLSTFSLVPLPLFALSTCSLIRNITPSSIQYIWVPCFTYLLLTRQFSNTTLSPC